MSLWEPGTTWRYRGSRGGDGGRDGSRGSARPGMPRVAGQPWKLTRQGRVQDPRERPGAQPAPSGSRLLLTAGREPIPGVSEPLGLY